MAHYSWEKNLIDIRNAILSVNEETERSWETNLEEIRDSILTVEKNSNNLAERVAVWDNFLHSFDEHLYLINLKHDKMISVMEEMLSIMKDEENE